MENRKGRLRAIFTEQRIILLIRWWAAGAVYFFIGWGTFVGSQQSLLGFVISLGLVMGLFNILIINPGLRLMFHIVPKRPANENSFAQRISDHLVELLKSVFIVFVVAMIYLGINQLLISLRSLPADAVPLPGEPILFALFYVLIFWLLDVAVTRIKAAIVNKRSAAKEE